MKLSEKSQILLERYLLAVERRLPLQGRKDMIAEIKANLMDTLEDHYPSETVLSEDQLEGELHKLGSPKSVSAAYFATDAMIAPQYNTIFRLVVTRLAPIVVAAVIFAGLLSFVITGGKSPFWSIWELLGTGWNVAVGIIGTVAIILVVLTRFFPKVTPAKELKALEEEDKNWKVGDLPELVVTQDKVHFWELVAGITFNVLALVFWLFLFDQLAGIWWLVGEKWYMVPIFTNAFIAFIPWIAINTGLDLTVNILMLCQAKRSIAARILEIGIKISEISLVASLLNAGPLVTFASNLAMEKGFPPEGIYGIQMLVQSDSLRWFLIFLLVVLGIDLLKKIVDIIRRSLAKN
jgi:hypothetical protein